MKAHGSKYRKIDGEVFLNMFRLKNPSNFNSYLRSVWEDLSRRSEQTTKGVCRLVFSNYYKVPSLICNRIFSLFDKGGDGYLSYLEFSNGMQSLFNSPLDQLMEVIFAIFDCDCDNFISSEDVHSVLQFIPLHSKHFSLCTFLDRVESQEEIKIFNMNLFAGRAQMDVVDFKYITKSEDSTIFLYFTAYLLSKKPFSNSTLKFYQNEVLQLASVKKSSCFIASPTHKSKFLSSFKVFGEENEVGFKSEQLPLLQSKLSRDEATISDCSLASLVANKQLTQAPENININNSLSSITHKIPSSHSSNSSLICTYLNSLTGSIESSSFSNSNSSCDLCSTDNFTRNRKIISSEVDLSIESTRHETFYEGYLLKNTNNKLKRLWFTLHEKYLYCKSIN